MATPEEIAAIRAKAVSERTDEEKAILQTADHTGADPKKPENMIPQSRFNEKLKELEQLKAQLEQTQQLAREAEEKRLKEANDYKTLYEQTQAELNTTKPKAAQVDAMEGTLNKLLESQILEMPEDRRGLVPEGLTTQGKLDWIAKNRAILMAPKAFDIGAGVRGGTQGTAQKVELTPEEQAWADKLGMSYEDYYKNR